MEIKDNVTLRHLEMMIGKEKAYIEYEKQGHQIYLTKVLVPDSENQEEAREQLIRLALEYIKENGWKLVPYTKTIKNFIRENPEYKGIVLNGIRI